MPAAALAAGSGKLWRVKCAKASDGKGGDKPYLFNHKALAKVFRAKLLAALRHEGLALPARLPEKWVVDCRCVGAGDKALVYLGRYLYHGVIQEKDILRCDNGQVSFRYHDAKSGQPAAAHRQRGHILVAADATCVAQRLSPCTQFRLSAAQQQTADRAVATGVEDCPHGTQRLGQAQSGIALSVLRRADAGGAKAYRATVT